MRKTKLSKFYRQKNRLVYHPRKDLLAERKGIKRFISFDDRFLTVARKLERLIKSFSKKKIKLLDIGVGDAVYESLLSKKSQEMTQVYGIDISKEQLKRGKKYLKEAKVIDLNSEKIPYKDEFFDIVIASEILEHVFYPDRVLAEASRVLKKNGYLILTYPNSGSLQLRLSLLFIGSSPLLNYPANREHIRFFNKANIIKMVKGLEIVQYRGLGSFLFGKWNFPFKIITPRVLQVFGNKFLPNLALGNLLIFKR